MAKVQTGEEILPKVLTPEPDREGTKSAPTALPKQKLNIYIFENTDEYRIQTFTFSALLLFDSPGVASCFASSSSSFTLPTTLGNCSGGGVGDGTINVRL